MHGTGELQGDLEEPVCVSQVRSPGKGESPQAGLLCTDLMQDTESELGVRLV